MGEQGASVGYGESPCSPVTSLPIVASAEKEKNGFLRPHALRPERLRGLC